MKAVFLVIDYVPHQIESINAFIKKNEDNHVLAFHVARFEKKIPEIKNFQTLLFTEFRKNEILKRIYDFNPDLLVTAGWMIPEFNWVCKKIKKNTEIPIVAYMDTQWYGAIKQRVNVLISPFHLRKAFDYLWVAGIYQYEYARRLGFPKNKILYGSLSANVELFNNINIEKKQINYPKNILYIGRFSEEKGIKNLIKAWQLITDKKQWRLTLIGKGDLKDAIPTDHTIIVKDYMDQEDLMIEFQNSGCFILPSTFEPWALVLHEAACAGLPIVCTDICGAAPHFVINNFNGYKISTINHVEEIKNAIINIIGMDHENLMKFSKRSRALGNTINSEISIANLLQVIK
ncbi:glycosyltransferase family 4 protein [Elizabethkingia anophelis]|uniref:glycosyltransferase family 4 protein n=1 Tax=Elizabethkingia anophelis TaxID=1117645 RepID=UPI000B364AB4|nr:glycosyltransferase family 4 protein [Elizabethkingia anophelis]MCT4326769.1 glycosyltransferase [Elizabethkingia anophelis]